MFTTTLDSNVLWMLGGIYVILVLASCITWLLSKKISSEVYLNLKLRIKSWWGMVFVFSLAMLFTNTVSLFFLGLVSFLALKEYFSMITVRRADRRVPFLGLPCHSYSILSCFHAMVWNVYCFYSSVLVSLPSLQDGSHRRN